jgi:hypothetical protein
VVAARGRNICCICQFGTPCPTHASPCFPCLLHGRHCLHTCCSFDTSCTWPCLPLPHPLPLQFVEKDPRLAEAVIRSLLKFWPLTNSHKEVLFLGELEEVLELTQVRGWMGEPIDAGKVLGGRLPTCLNASQSANCPARAALLASPRPACRRTSLRGCRSRCSARSRAASPAATSRCVLGGLREQGVMLWGLHVASCGPVLCVLALALLPACLRDCLPSDCLPAARLPHCPTAPLPATRRWLSAVCSCGITST